ncbi:MFS transporter [Nonomuraea fuscirosea]|uniref:MFS transporter n=1 Tax=Nonomuraea fuscirosea TaxID=1291556 RepID=UPI0037A96BD0
MAEAVRPQAPRPDSPWQVRAFRTFFAATTFEILGNNLAFVTVPLVAVSVLDAGAGQVGTLATLGTVAALVIGLPAGAWVDRVRPRRVLIAAELAQAALPACLLIAWWLGALTLWQMYAVALLRGVVVVFAVVGTMSQIPRLVDAGKLPKANAALMSLVAGANAVGQGLGGLLLQALTAPAGLAGTVMSHLLSACLLMKISDTERSVPESRRRGTVRSEVAAGLRHVLRDKELRGLAVSGACTNLGSQIVNTVLPVMFVRELGLPIAMLGVFWTAGGCGLLLGTRCARLIARRVGLGRTLGLLGFLVAPAGLLVPLVGGGGWLWMGTAGWAVITFRIGVNNVLGVSLQQLLTPPAMLGRMHAVFRIMSTGAVMAGAVMAGVVGELAGVRAALWMGGVLMAASFVPVFLSPARARRDFPAPVAAQEALSQTSEASQSRRA